MPCETMRSLVKKCAERSIQDLVRPRARCAPAFHQTFLGNEDNLHWVARTEDEKPYANR